MVASGGCGGREVKGVNGVREWVGVNSRGEWG